MKSRTLKYIYSIIFVLIFVNSQSQQLIKKQIFPSDRSVYVRVGADISRFLLPYINKIPVYGFELFADTELKYKFFPIVEMGMNKINHNTNYLKYNLQGYYFRLGLNYNMVKYQHHTDRNMFYIGVRYAYSYSTQKGSDILFNNEWGSVKANYGKQNIITNWVEGVLGLQGEIFKNLFLGIGLRLKMQIPKNNQYNVVPYFIPGFGKGEKTVSSGISYTISYSIPIKRVRL